MIDEGARKSVLGLAARGYGIRKIARLMKVSRPTVRQILKSGDSTPPAIKRVEKAHAHHDLIEQLNRECKGRRLRMWEKLLEQEDAPDLSYQAFTAYCRRHGVGVSPPIPAGRYQHKPGHEMQHDTSPHFAEIGRRTQRVQIAGLVFAFSRRRFIQFYPRFTRFECKVFLDDGFDYFMASARPA